MPNTPILLSQHGMLVSKVQWLRNALPGLQEVRAELSALLSEPLQPSFSRKFFTGGAAAAVAAHLPSAGPAAGAAGASPAAAAAAAAGGGKKGKRKAAAGGAAAGAGDGAPAEPAGHAPPGAAATVSSAVQLARQMAASRARAAVDVKQKAAKVGLFGLSCHHSCLFAITPQ
jgi:hypothetical protein